MNILVTGGAGFIASHIVDAYINAGHHVWVVDNLRTGRRENLNPAATFIECDVRDSAIGRVLQENAIECVNHHAAQIDVRASVANPAADAEINIIGGLNLYEQCAAHGVRKIIFASTGGAIYGEQDYFPADENHPTRPDSPYGISKLANEKYLEYYRKQYGITTVILRYTNVYGPRQNPHGEAGVVAIFSEKLCRGEQPVINGDGLQTRDYVFVDDVVRANVSALAASSSDVFNVCTGIETSVVDVFNILKSEIAPQCAEVHAPAKAGEQQRSVATCAKAQRILGWSPTTKVQEGLRQTARFFKGSV